MRVLNLWSLLGLFLRTVLVSAGRDEYPGASYTGHGSTAAGHTRSVQLSVELTHSCLGGAGAS
jgi:hypothetical protein